VSEGYAAFSLPPTCDGFRAPRPTVLDPRTLFSGAGILPKTVRRRPSRRSTRTRAFDGLRTSTAVSLRSLWLAGFPRSSRRPSTARRGSGAPATSGAVTPSSVRRCSPRSSATGTPSGCVCPGRSRTPPTRMSPPASRGEPVPGPQHNREVPGEDPRRSRGSIHPGTEDRRVARASPDG